MQNDRFPGPIGHTLYKGKKIVPKDLPSLKIHASPLRNSLAAEEAAGGPRARARSVVHITRHEATLSHGTALGARQPCPSMIHVRARACSDDGCLRMTARTRKRRSTQIGQCRSCARAEHGLSCFTQPMHDRHDAEPLNLPARAQESHVHLRGRHAGARRRHQVDIGLRRSEGWIEGLGLLSWVRGSGACIRLLHLCTNTNTLLVTVYAHTSAREQAQQIRYDFRTRAQAYVRSGPPCDSHCEPQCLRLWHREVYCEACGVTSREAFRAGAGGGL